MFRCTKTQHTVRLKNEYWKKIFMWDPGIYILPCPSLSNVHFQSILTHPSHRHSLVISKTSLSLEWYSCAISNPTAELADSFVEKLSSFKELYDFTIYCWWFLFSWTMNVISSTLTWFTGSLMKLRVYWFYLHFIDELNDGMRRGTWLLLVFHSFRISFLCG